MATPPTFSSGAILTAAQMNAIGSWLVKSVTVGTTISSVDVTSCFSADFDSYRVVYSGGVGSTSGDLRFYWLPTSTTGYNTSFDSIVRGSQYSGGAVSGSGFSNQGNFFWVGGFDTTFTAMNIDILNPFTTKYSTFSGIYYGPSDGGISMGIHRQSQSYTGFRLFPSSGTLTGGTIRVYGYRN